MIDKQSGILQFVHNRFMLGNAIYDYYVVFYLDVKLNEICADPFAWIESIMDEDPAVPENVTYSTVNTNIQDQMVTSSSDEAQPDDFELVTKLRAKHTNGLMQPVTTSMYNGHTFLSNNRASVINNANINTSTVTSAGKVYTNLDYENPDELTALAQQSSPESLQQSPMYTHIKGKQELLAVSGSESSLNITFYIRFNSNDC